MTGFLAERVGGLATRGATVALLFCAASAFAAPAAQQPATAALADLGAKIFSDTSLSASGQMACASCHDPAHAHAQSNAAAVQSGGANLDVAGFRAVPSLRYLNFNVPFFFASDGTPTGGFNRDGRAKDLIAQSDRPFLAPHEMANADAASAVARLALSEYVGQFRGLFGADIFADPDRAFLAMRYAVSVFENTASQFRPFSSKFDLFLKGKIKLTTQELRGYAWFNSQAKGGCAGCHPSKRPSDGSPPVFTDYTYDNLGVPRNVQIPANLDPTYFDMGLCGPERTDLLDRGDLCGQFKVPTLRNVATRQVIFHNGQFHTLREAIQFYVQRDTNPEKWYPLDVDGQPLKFDDVPWPFQRNVNQSEVPYNRLPGDQPALSEAEIDDVVVFLGTLTDGYDPMTNTADPARDVPPVEE